MKSFVKYIFIIFYLFSFSTFAAEEIELVKDNKKFTIDEIDQSNFLDLAILQNLNKITTKINNLEIKVGEEVKSGRLYIKIHKCWKAPLYEKPENKILLEVFQNNNDKKERIFYGWMFSSSPSLSGLEHPIYDITAIECVDSKIKEANQKQNEQ
jgi:hypothetical protein